MDDNVRESDHQLAREATARWAREPVTLPGADGDSQWYAIHVHPQREYEVAYRQRRLGLSTFVPTELRTHKRTSYAKGVTQFAVPTIPGCIFVGFPSTPAWYDVLRDPRIVAPFGMDGRPWRLKTTGEAGIFRYFAHTLDGCLVRDADVRMVYVPGVGKVRSLNTRLRIVSTKKREQATAAKKAARDRGEIPVIQPSRHVADFLARFVLGDRLS